MADQDGDDFASRFGVDFTATGGESAGIGQAIAHYQIELAQFLVLLEVEHGHPGYTADFLTDMSEDLSAARRG